MVANIRAGVLVEQLYQELEVWYPYFRLKEAGIETFLIGPEKNKVYPGKTGYPARSELSAKEALRQKFHCLIIPGGYAPDHLRRYEEIINLVKKLNDENAVIGSICHGAWVLASADIVKGRKLTCFYAIKDDLIHAGAHYVDAEVVVDRNLVTSRRPEDLPAFMSTILKLLIR